MVKGGICMKSIYAVALVAVFGLVGCQHAPQATTQNKAINFAELTKPVETNFPYLPTRRTNGDCGIYANLGQPRKAA